ncbi:VIT1/CCC1 transporter family protein [Candidatus Woesearchaeota archaeon]|nr:VIT1/CCC1 transporter family protein [Candidatus Woesearchaeota archaeon]
MATHELNGGAWIKDVILGGQDGLVNVLGIVLGVAAATHDSRIIIISGLAGTVAESISMAAVAYTSSKAARDYYYGELEREKREMKDMPQEERREIRDIYAAKGFKGPLLARVVKTITSKPEIWLQTMMAEELRMFPDDYDHPFQDAVVVGIASLFGSLVPLVSFFFLPVDTAVIVSLIIAALVLFVTGAIKAKLTIGDWRKAGIEMMCIGMLAALGGYAIGVWLGALPLG